MAEAVIAWYSWLSGLTQGPILLIQDWIEGSNVPLVSALLFGLIGATSPCQLTTNLGALAFSASRAGTAPVLGASLAYVAGKVLVYSVVGGLAVVLGLQLQGATIPVVLVARTLLGPLMLLVGLGLLGLVRLPGGFGLSLSRRLAGQVPGSGRGAFLLGVAFSFAFCPTLFWLFFGLTVPLALRSPAVELSWRLRRRHRPAAPGAGYRGVSRLGRRRPAGWRPGPVASAGEVGRGRSLHRGRAPRHADLLVALMPFDLPERGRVAWLAVRWVLAGAVVALGLTLLALTIREAPGGTNMPFDHWYGNWRAVLLVSAVFTAFVIGFARPRRRVEWRNAGISTAFFVSLFTEMFGIPLTVYLLAPLLGLPPAAFGMNESHLWAFLLARLGVLPLDVGVYVVMLLSVGLIAVGVSLVAVGWATVYRGRGGLVTSGIYRHLRHPQYLGLILIVLAFNIQWPTLPTLVMAPLLIFAYLGLARREDRELAGRFGEAFRAYAARTRAFLPSQRHSRAEGAALR